MSFRLQSLTDDALVQFLRKLRSDLDDLQAGTGNVGLTSFGALQVGAVQLVEAKPGDSTRALLVRNSLTGAQYPLPIDGSAASAAPAALNASAAVGAALVAVSGMSVTLKIPATLVGLVDVEVSVAVASVAASGGTAKLGVLRSGVEVGRFAVLGSGVTVPVGFVVRDRRPSAGTFTYALGALVSAGSATVGNGTDGAQLTARIVPTAT